MKITKKQLTYLVESEVRKQLKLHGNKINRRALRINESALDINSVAEELVDILNPVLDYAINDATDDGYTFTIDDNEVKNLEDYVDMDTYQLDVDEVEGLLAGARELTITFYIGDYQDNFFENFNWAINRLMRKYPMYTGEVLDDYYKIHIPLNDLSSLSMFLDELIMNRNF